MIKWIKPKRTNKRLFEQDCNFKLKISEEINGTPRPLLYGHKDLKTKALSEQI